MEDRAKAENTPEPILPDGCMEIVFDLADRFLRLYDSDKVERQPVTIVAGQIRRHILVQPTGRVELFGIRFHPAGAFPFFDFSLSELTDKTENIDSIWGSEGREIEARVSEAGSFGERVAIIELDLTKRLLANKKLDSAAVNAARIIVQNNGTMPIRSVANVLGVSERNLEREFKQKIGVSPKMFSRIMRFQQLLRSLEKSGSNGLLDRALEFGYYDQAHMVHEFSEFAGKSPTAFIEDSHRISEVFTAK